MIVDVSGPWPVTFDTATQQPVTLKTPAGVTTLTLLDVQHSFEPDYWTGKTPDKQTFASAILTVDIDGTKHQILHRPYQMPVTLGHVRLSVETTRDWITSGGLTGQKDFPADVRFSAVPAGQTWGPASVIFPIANYRWRSATYRNTWAALVPFNLLYYHRGEDFGAIPDRLDLLAILPGTVVSTPLPGSDKDSNYIEIDLGHGIRFGYAHMNIETFSPGLTSGVTVAQRQTLARTGMTWNGSKTQHQDPHVHLDLARDGHDINCYPMLAEAYFRTYDDPLLPVAGGFAFATVGQTIDLDGSRSLARPGRSIQSYRWRLHDGAEVAGSAAKVHFDQPGYYAEELIVTADNGTEDRDSIHVRVYDPAVAGQPIAMGWAYYSPTRNIKPGQPVTFWNRLGGTSDVTIDFGDGAKPEPIAGELTHAYPQSGLYTVTLKGNGPRNEPVLHKLRIRID